MALDSQVTDTVLMIRPANFGYNPETAPNNIYQRRIHSLSPDGVRQQALKEFDEFVRRLSGAGVEVIVVNEPPDSTTTDSVFPNNWITTHTDGTVVTYPMWAPSRRLERREEIISELEKRRRVISRRVDYSHLEAQEGFLEGTGSMVLDRRNRVAYACISPRTHEASFRGFCQEFGYTPLAFSASQPDAAGALVPVYHSNVMMSIGENVAVICSDTIRDSRERDRVMESLVSSGRHIIQITEDQCRRFAGNMLQVASREGELLLVMSEQAYRSLSAKQVERIRGRSEILYTPLETIEACGGGSARCMLAEVMLPREGELVVAA